MLTIIAMYGGIKYCKEQHTFNPLAQHNQQTYKGEHTLSTAPAHTYGIQSAQPPAALHPCCCNSDQHLHNIGTCKPFAQELLAQHHRHNIPSALHTIGTTHYWHYILLALHTIGTTYYWHNTLSALYTIGTTYYQHITLATQHTIGTMYMILSQSFTGKCKIYLCSNSSMLPIYINSKSIYNCRGWQH